MKKILPIAIVIVLLATIASSIAFAGLRIVVIPPLNGQPGKTILATGLREISLIDSPEAYCQRQGDEDLTCPISFSMAIAHEGNVLIELPYIDALQKMTDAH